MTPTASAVPTAPVLIEPPERPGVAVPDGPAFSGRMERVHPTDSAELRKARGAFFTPAAVARFIVAWAIRDVDDAILEPSCGEAVFLREAGRLGGHRGRLVGVELHERSAESAARSLRADGIDADILVGDFFGHEEFGAYDAVIGNPPYVRFHDFSGAARNSARTAALRGGVALSRLASSWAAFTVHAALHVKRGGRLGLVLPAELLSVNYAAGVRRFLLDHFATVSLVLFEERIFPGVQEEVVLVLAEGFDADGARGTDTIELTQVRRVADLADLPAVRQWSPTDASAKWSGALMSQRGLEAFTGALGHAAFCDLEEWGDTTLGMVTGNNKYFTLTPAEVADLGLVGSDVLRISPPGSRHLRTLALTDEDLERLGDADRATYLFRPAGQPSRAAERYIRIGADAGVPTAYKCRVRTPWWRVPLVRPADLFLTYMNADAPRLVTNTAGVRHLNSVHGVYLREGHAAIGRDLLPIASLNSLTMLGAETVGRAYGGGLLKVEPREADRLPVPSPRLLGAHASTLARLRPDVTALLRAGRPAAAVDLVDAVILRDGLDMTEPDLAAIRAELRELSTRRRKRGKDAVGG